MAYPTLNPNEIFAPLFNQIISQEVFANNIAQTGSELVDLARVDGSMYGDTKLYYATKPLYSSAWGNDAEATKLLELRRPEAPETQAIQLNVFRQIKLTTDDYLTKRAWGTVDSFSSFNSIMKGWIRDTKRIYDATTYNAFIGTMASTKGKQTQTINVTEAVGSATGEEAARIEGAAIGEGVAKLITDLKDITEDYNDYGILRSYDINDLIFVWSSDAMAAVEKRDLPTIYHKDIIDKFGEYVLPSRYFGTKNTTNKEGDGKTIRSLVEQVVTKASSPNVHVFAGQLIPTGYTAPANTTYTVDNTVLFKVFHKKSVPYMSAFEVGTSFFNQASLTDTNFLTWGHNTLDYLKNYPCVTVKKA